MPLYEYQSDGEGCDHCRDRFEVMEKVSDPPLTKCPECGGPCHRVFSSFAPMKGTKSMLSPENLGKKGFTQYQRAGDGYYEKTCGKGPRVIKK
jgi:putative FmdB family regulatory protein